jgi:uncharacterized protein with HEPN domain
LEKNCWYRNVLAHGYDILENDLVWNTIEKHLPILEKELTAFL